MILKPNSHIGFVCHDLDTSIRFYKNVLGCTEKFSLYYGDMLPQDPEELSRMPQDVRQSLEENKDVRWIVYLEWMDGFFIELFNELNAHKDNPYDPACYGYTHFSFVVDDIHAFYNDMIAKGASEYLDLKPQMNCDHTWSCWFHDPDGNRVEVHQYTEQSFQIIGR